MARPEKKKLSGVAAAQANLDQAQAAFEVATAARAAAAGDAQRIQAQIDEFEEAVRAGDPAAAPGQLIELQGLGRFAVLQLEASDRGVQAAERARLGAQVLLLAAERQEHADVHGDALTATFWTAVTALQRLVHETDRAASAAASFDRRKQALLAQLGQHGPIDQELNDALVVLDAAPTPTTTFGIGVIEGLALKEAWGNTPGLIASAAGMRSGLTVSDLPAIAAGRTGDGDV